MSNAKNAPQESKMSRVLETKRVEDILSPRPIYVTIDDKEYRVLPMRKKELLRVGECLREIVGTLQAVFDLDSFSEMSPTEISEAILPIIPNLASALMPHAEALIRGALRIDEDEDFVVEDKLTLGGRIHMMHLILEVEDIPLLIKSFQELMVRFKGVFPAASAVAGNTPLALKPAPAPETPTVTG